MFNLSSCNFISRLYLNCNFELTQDNEFGEKIFIDACIKSNHKLAEYICVSNQNITSNILNNGKLQFIFENMCQKSELEIIIWFYNKFSKQINLENCYYIKKSCCNSNYGVIRWFLTQGIRYSKKVYEYVFKKSIERLDLITAKIIYGICPSINLEIIDSVVLHYDDNLNVFICNSIVEWLINVGRANSYLVKYVDDYKLVVIDLFGIAKYNKEQNNSEYIENEKCAKSEKCVENEECIEDKECVLCMNSPNEIILNCSHKYCRHCIQKWIKKNYSCPTCRKCENIEFYHL